MKQRDKEQPEPEAGAAPATPASALVAELYRDLKRLAHRERSRVGSPLTLQTTALIHEAYLKLDRGGNWSGRGQFMCAAAAAMRHALVDAARARLSQKRGGGQAFVPLDDELMESAALTRDDVIVDVDEALERLAALNPRLAQVVECRFFCGYTDTETAAALEVTVRTVGRDWAKAKAWLSRELFQG